MIFTEKRTNSIIFPLSSFSMLHILPLSVYLKSVFLLPSLSLLFCHPASSPGIVTCSLFLQVRLTGTSANVQLILYQFKPLYLLLSLRKGGKGDLSTPARCNVFSACVLCWWEVETEMVYFQLYLWLWVIFVYQWLFFGFLFSGGNHSFC